VLGSQRNLWLSGLFSEVDLHSMAPGDSQRVVQLRVTEADLQRLELGAGFTTLDFFQFDALFTRVNFFGGARRLTVRATVANLLAGQLNGTGVIYDVTNGATGEQRDKFLAPTWSASLELSQPWFLSPRNQLGTSVFAHRRSVPGIVIDRGAGVTAAFTNEFSPGSNSTLGYTFETSSVDASDVYFCVNFGVCEPAMIEVVATRNRLAPVSWVTQVDASNDVFSPSRGYRARLDVEHASGATASDFRFNRVFFNASAYHPLSKNTVLAGKLRLGWLGPLGGTSRALGIPTPLSGEIVHPRKRFYAGGSHSVRGFGENQLGPRVLTVSSRVLTDTTRASSCTAAQLADGSCDPNEVGVPATAFQPRPIGGTTVAEASVEYRFPIAMQSGLTGALFIDGAVVRGGQFSNVIGAVASITPGAGIRFDTPVGPVRLDLGIRPTLVERLPVVTDVVQSDGTERLVTLSTLRLYDPLDRSGNLLRGILNRLMLHLAIGPAF
jgi:outer membrane protein assembly factor BamA